MNIGPLRSDAASVGVDLGCSGVRAWRVVRRGEGLAVSAGPCEREFAGGDPGFAPLELALQLAQLGQGDLDPGICSPVERAEGARRSALIADAIAQAADGAAIELALAAPGLRSRDGRGIVAARNGPRLPRLLADLERELAARGVALTRALPPLIGDGEAAGWGELVGCEGSLRGVGTGLVLVGGSGLAEALVHAGRARPLESLEPPLLRAHELSLEGDLRGILGENDSSGRPALTLEDGLAPGRLNAAWRSLGGTLPFERAAAEGDLRAQAFRAALSETLAAHLARRAAEFARHPQAAPLERIALGGALARMLERDAAWRAELEARLVRRLTALEGKERAGWLQGGGLGEGRLRYSQLRAAPALGALAARLP